MSTATLKRLACVGMVKAWIGYHKAHEWAWRRKIAIGERIHDTADYCRGCNAYGHTWDECKEPLF